MAWFRRGVKSELEIFLAARNHIWVQSEQGVWLVACTVMMVNISHMRKPGADPDFAIYFWRDEEPGFDDLFDGDGWNLLLVQKLIEHCQKLKNEG